MSDPAKAMILRMATGSMRPVIAEGDFILALPRADALPRAGEIWVLPPHGPLAERHAHRVVRVYREDGRWWLAARGDSSAAEDPPLRADFALARVTAVGRELGRRPHPAAWALAPLSSRWLLGGGAGRCQRRLERARKALWGRPGAAARLARRALLQADLYLEELLAGARARGLLTVMTLAAVRANIESFPLRSE